jgi:adenylate kinase family enzyme
MNLENADLQRINLVGTSASGKSTLGKRLAAILNSPYVEMDALYHGPNWTQAQPEVFRARVADAVAGPRWILDGNYNELTHDLKWARATMILWLDISFVHNMYRAVARAVHRSWTQEELWPGTGNRESFRQTFCSKESMILWTATSYQRRVKEYSKIQQSPPDGIKFVRLGDSPNVAKFLESVRALNEPSFTTVVED